MQHISRNLNVIVCWFAGWITILSFIVSLYLFILFIRGYLLLLLSKDRSRLNWTLLAQHWNEPLRYVCGVFYGVLFVPLVFCVLWCLFFVFFSSANQVGILNAPLHRADWQTSFNTPPHDWLQPGPPTLIGPKWRQSGGQQAPHLILLNPHPATLSCLFTVLSVSFKIPSWRVGCHFCRTVFSCSKLV